MIKIDNKTNIRSLEKAYKELYKGGVIDITISKGLTSADFGLIPAIIQFFATWFNNTKGGKIILDLKIETNFTAFTHVELEHLSDDKFGAFYKFEYIFPSLVYCWSREIVDTNQLDIKPLVKILNEKKHEKMKRQTEGGGTQTLLSCFDHLSTKKGLLSAFYIDDTFIANELQFDTALDKSLKQVLSVGRHLRKENFSLFHFDVIAIIYELMKNTDDWAKTDVNNIPLNPNTRGLYMKLHRRTRNSFLTGFEKNEGLKDYFSNENFVSNNQDELYFLELSVYDTGIGFVQRYKSDSNKRYDPNEQVEIVKQCLLENNTSAVGLERTYKGKGLDRIMNILNNKGFFWLRTSNVSIFRNLRKNNHKKGCSAKEIELYDWFNNSTSNFSDLAFVKGSVITLVYPISNLSNV